MKMLFTRSLFPYLIGTILTIIISGAVLSQIVDNYVILIAVLFIEMIVLTLLLLHVFERYIKPVNVAKDTVEKLVQGNYRARVHHSATGTLGDLMNEINALAKNLSELSIHEQMQSEQLSTVIDNTESGLVLIDEKGLIHLVNRKFLSIFGGKPLDYVGALIYDVLDSEEIHQTVQDTFLYERRRKSFITKGSGIERAYLEVAGAPIFNESGMLKGAVLVFYDITELKKLENMRKDFVANVSHELKTPITSIKGFAETLVGGTVKDDATAKQFTEIIYEESYRLQLLVDDLLILSRLEQDQFKLNVSRVSPIEMIEGVKPIIEQKAKDHKVNFTIKDTVDTHFQADPKKVKQVLLNLLGNAISYTPENGDVTLEVKETDDEVQFEVVDTGIGIKEEQLPRIFERFYRVDMDRSRNSGGTGLGLAIVKHIMEVHKGEIKLRSEWQKGSTFTACFRKEI